MKYGFVFPGGEARTAACTYASLMSLAPGVWYRGQLVIDSSQRFYARVWRVDNPAGVAESWAAHSDWSGMEWKFKNFVLGGTEDLDEYKQSLLYGKGQRARMTDGSGTTQWSYDNRGQVIAERKVVGSEVFYTRWGYNAAGLQSWIRYPGGNAGQSGERVSYTYHPQMLVNNVVGDYSYVPGIQYDAAGRLVQLVRGQGTLTTSYTYYGWTEISDLDGQQVGQGARLKQMATGTLQDLRYVYDAVGNVRTIQDYKAVGGTQTQTQTFSYDALDRLTSAGADLSVPNGGYGPESYTYHPDTGNLSTKAGVSYGYNDSARKHAVTHLAGVQKYWYDANGNMITRIVGATTYSLSYDAENRMTAVSGGGLSASFVYDGDGNRVKGTIAGVSTVYISNTFEWTGSTSTMKKYFYASGVRVAMREGSSDPKWLLADHLSSSTITASYTGSRLAELAYEAWGENRYSYGATPTTYRYTGQRQEILLGGVDGLYFYNARWYDSSLGRFLSADTVIPQPGDSQAWDRFAYSLNNPVKYVDPTGYWVEIPLDIAFIAYDLYQINQEGWTLVNTVALVADVACAIVPIGTGGGPAVRVAMAGGDAVLTYSRAAAQVPDVIRAGQAAEKVFQFSESNGDLGTGLPDVASSDNSQGNPIPGIKPPSNYGGLRDAMLNAGLEPPSSMATPQAHHNLPWSLKDWFAGPGRGLNINDPQFGRWISGGPQGPHQRWSSKYNRAWQTFQQQNPHATRKQVLDYLQNLLDSGRFPSSMIPNQTFYIFGDNTFYDRGFAWATSIHPRSEVIHNICQNCGSVKHYPVGDFDVTVDKGSKYPDVLGCGGYPFLIVSERAIEAWQVAGLCCFHTYKVNIAEIGSARLRNVAAPQYYRVDIDGKCQIDLEASGAKIVKFCPECHHLETAPFVLQGFRMVPGSWDGNSIFRDPIYYPLVKFLYRSCPKNRIST